MHRLKVALCILAVIAFVILLCGLEVKEKTAMGYEYQSCNQLWDLTQYCPDDMDKWEYIALIMQLNAMDDMTVYSDRLYQVPIYEK
ncbi:MAG: hypothetical protein J6C82_05090 [Clostridia bacterium]|nr:hypothetical protein [Clostridia bacterium]